MKKITKSILNLLALEQGICGKEAGMSDFQRDVSHLENALVSRESVIGDESYEVWTETSEGTCAGL